jgi:hypothetical protein
MVYKFLELKTSKDETTQEVEVYKTKINPTAYLVSEKSAKL